MHIFFAYLKTYNSYFDLRSKVLRLGYAKKHKHFFAYLKT